MIARVNPPTVLGPTMKRPSQTFKFDIEIIKLFRMVVVLDVIFLPNTVLSTAARSGIIVRRAEEF